MCFIARVTNPPTHNPRPDARQARHLEMLEELANLAMALTRAAAPKAQAHIEHPAEGPDPVTAFTRLARTVRQTIALEARIANPKPTRDPTTPKPVDEPRELIAESARAFAKADPAATRRHGPTRTHIERHIDERIDADDITQLIDQDMPLYVMVSTICDDLGVKCAVEDQPDENLVPLSEALQARREGRIYHPPLPLPPAGEGRGEGKAESTTPRGDGEAESTIPPPNDEALDGPPHA